MTKKLNAEQLKMLNDIRIGRLPPIRLEGDHRCKDIRRNWRALINRGLVTGDGAQVTDAGTEALAAQVKLTVGMFDMLTRVREGKNPLEGVEGAAARGGANSVLAGLRNRGLLQGNHITIAGRRALRDIARKRAAEAK